MKKATLNTGVTIDDFKKRANEIYKSQVVPQVTAHKRKKKQGNLNTKGVTVLNDIC